jgi:transcriptional regulator GlxA family with amidase domain
MRVGIVLFDQVDLMDVGGPYEVFLTASRLGLRDGDPAPFEVITVSRTADPVVAYGGLRLVADTTFDAVGRLDVLVVPGAIAIDDVVADEGLLAAVRQAGQASGLVTSVCTGAFLLGELGLLAGRGWTTHWEDVDALQERVGGGGRTGVRWVDAGEVVTAGGLTSGIAMALHLVDRLAGRDLAVRTARQLDYAWEPDGGT